MKLFVSCLVAMVVAGCAYSVPQDQVSNNNKDFVIPNSVIMDSGSSSNSDNELDSGKPDVHVFSIPDANTYNETFTCLVDSNKHIYYLDCIGSDDAGYCDLKNCINEPIAPVCHEGKCIQN